MPAPLIPLALGAGLGLWAVYEQQRAKEQRAAAQPPPLPPIPLVPGAEAYLPPVAAPEPIRNAMANALFSQNSTALRTTAKNLQELGYGDVAGPLLARADAIDSAAPAASGWTGFMPLHRSAVPVPWARRRSVSGDDLEALAATAGVGAWFDDTPGHREAALLGWERRRGAAGADPDIYIGALPTLARRRATRRLVRSA